MVHIVLQKVIINLKALQKSKKERLTVAGIAGKIVLLQ